MLNILVAASILITPHLKESELPQMQLLRDSEEVICLATNMYFESRNQSILGQLAVANVVLNRVKSKRFPNTVCTVVYQSKLNWKGNPRRNACHFSWWCDGKSDKVYDRDTYMRILRLAALVYRDQDRIIDVTHGATHYHAKYVDPWWTKGFKQTVTVGDHIFYKEE